MRDTRVVGRDGIDPVPAGSMRALARSRSTVRFVAAELARTGSDLEAFTHAPSARAEAAFVHLLAMRRGHLGRCLCPGTSGDTEPTAGDLAGHERRLRDWLYHEPHGDDALVTFDSWRAYMGAFREALTALGCVVSGRTLPAAIRRSTGMETANDVVLDALIWRGSPSWVPKYSGGVLTFAPAPLVPFTEGEGPCLADRVSLEFASLAASATVVDVPAGDVRVCHGCGATFERERKRGRPPIHCPACTAAALSTARVADLTPDQVLRRRRIEAARKRAGRDSGT